MTVFANFQISSYVLEVRAATGFGRQIVLTSTAQAHGIDNDARLIFLRDASDARVGQGEVRNVGAPNFDGLSIVAYYALDEFDAISRMLQTEKPVFFNFNYSDSGGTTRDLDFSSVGTSAEPLGEGPSDAQA